MTILRWISFALAAGAVLFDASTTYRALSRGRREANPIRRGAIRAFGSTGGTYGVAIVVSVALAFATLHGGLGVAIGNLFVCGAFLIAASWNREEL